MLSRVLPQRFKKVAYTFLLSIGLPALALSFDNIDFCSWTISTCIVSGSDIEHLEWPNHFKCDGSELGAERLSPTISLENINPVGLVPDHLEIAALRNLYDSTNGANWTNNTGWPSTQAAWDTILTVSQIVDWYGLTISNDDIKKVGLSGNGLTGNIPASLSNLAGLRELILDDNQLSGTIPASLGDLELLSFLYLHANNLVGTIPPELGKLNQLSHLYLYSNSLTGSIPPELGNMSALVFLHVAHNQLSGEIPFELSGLNNLEALALNYNLFETVLPDWLGNLPSMKMVILSGNDFYGALPRSFTSSATLVSIFAENNQLTHFPDFSSHPNPGTVTINIANNYIPQADIDANMVGGQPIFAAFTYAPQKMVPSDQGKLLDIVEISALRDFYESTGGANWTDNTGWPSTSAQWDTLTSIEQAATWFGVTIDSGDVSKLDLRDNYLVGTIPGSIANLSSLKIIFLGEYLTSNQLSGPIPTSIEGLWNLEQLHLSGNQLSGEIPPSIFDLEHINYISLGGNSLSGSIPSNVGNASNLRVLSLASNNLTGEIPSSIGNLKKCDHLFLHTLNLEGGIPKEIGGMESLGYLSMYASNLSGPIPAEIGSCSLLHTIYLNQNNLSGSLPASMGHLSKLRILALQHNNFTGTIPSSFGQLVNLTSISFRKNNFTGAFPVSVARLPNLVKIEIHFNNFTSFPDISTDPNAPNLDVAIQHNYIQWEDIAANLNIDSTYSFNSFVYSPQNEIPVTEGQVLDLAEITSLRDLYESTNGAHWTNNTGWPSAPAAWDTITSIDQVATWFGVTVDSSDVSALDLRNNNLLGTIPRSVGNLLSLKSLVLGEYQTSNQLSGEIPTSIGDLKHLEYLILAGNQLTGEIPPGLFDIPSMKYLAIGHNSLSGVIPANVGNATNLGLLGLGGNNLTGEIPPSIGNLKKCSQLALNSLNLSGGIPKEIGGMESLGYLHLAGSNLSGAIPEELGSCSKLHTLYLHQNNFNGPLPASLGNLTALRTLHINNNSFSGTIPSSLDQLKNLNSIMFRVNNFTGAFPRSVALLPNLVAIEIHKNQFTSFPNISSHPNAPNLRVAIQSNYIPWDDIAANLNVDSTYSFNSFVYSPQNEIPVTEGRVLDLAEITSLRDLYESTNGAQWTNNTGWPSTPAAWDSVTSIDQVTGWYGVTIENGDITAIRLPNNNLSGTLPTSLNNLLAVEVLAVDMNSLSGDIPSLSSLLLKELVLSKNNFGGEIPAWIMNSTSLVQLYLGECGLTGKVPMEISNLVSLEVLSLSNNSLTGLIPSSIGAITSLRDLQLDRNQFVGVIPGELGQLGNLQAIRLWSNQLTGNLPASLGNLNQLEILFIHNNELTGTIPQGIADLPNLQYIYANNNRLNGDIPSFSSTARLKQLQIQNNPGITSIPDFTALSSISLLVVNNTFLSFDHLEQNSTVTGFVFDPLHDPSVLVEKEFILGDSISLSNDRAGGANTTYQWQEWGGTQWVDLAGQNAETLDLDTITIDDHGRRFRCEMTNTQFAGITLYNHEAELRVIIPLTFYVISDGDWSDPTAWSLTDGGLPENKLPTRYDEVRIKDFQVEVTSQVDCRELNISAGPRTRVVVSGKDARLTINGDVVIHNLDARDNEILQVMNQGKLECK